MTSRYCRYFLAFALTASPLIAQTLAPRPPMGWNSWDSYGLTVTEAQFRDNVAVLTAKLKPFGYYYAVIDEGWFFPNPEDRETPDKLRYQLDANGRYIPVPARFPSSLENGENTGFRALSAYVHAQGLQFGIHIVRGIPRESVTRNLPVAGSAFTAQDVADTSDACPWDPTNWGIRDNPAGQAWYDSLISQYASWGVDFVKVDCISDHPYKSSEIRQIHNAIVKSGRPMILSLSPGPTNLSHAKEVGELAQQWRISDDLWDYWSNPKPFPKTVHDQFALLAAWQPYNKPGNWPDADMLPLGHIGPNPGEGRERETRLTHDEQQTLMSLWSIARSPLILGANLTQLDPRTLTLLTNRKLLAMDQEGHNQKQALHEGDLVAWTSEGQGKTRYLALFNLGDTPLSVDRPLTGFRLPPGPCKMNDLWTDGAEIGTAVKATLRPHATLLLEVTAAP